MFGGRDGGEVRVRTLPGKSGGVRSRRELLSLFSIIIAGGRRRKEGRSRLPGVVGLGRKRRKPARARSGGGGASGGILDGGLVGNLHRVVGIVDDVARDVLPSLRGLKERSEERTREQEQKINTAARKEEINNYLKREILIAGRRERRRTNPGTKMKGGGSCWFRYEQNTEEEEGREAR